MKTDGSFAELYCRVLYVTQGEDAEGHLGQVAGLEQVGGLEDLLVGHAVLFGRVEE